MNSHYEKFLATGVVKCIDSEIPFDIPNGWEWVRMSNVVSLLSGRDLEPEKYNDNGNGIPYITGASNFNNNGLLINRWTDSPITISNLGDLLITCKGTIGAMAFNTIGRIHIARQVMSISSLFINLRYLKIFLSSNIYLLEAQANSMIPGISRETLLNSLVPLPPLCEQERIVVKYEHLLLNVNKYGELQLSLDELNADIYIQLKKSILQEAIQGKLVPQDPTEGTAEELLQQIKADKVKLVKEGKLKKQALADSIIFKGDDNRYYEQIGKETVPIETDFDFPNNWQISRLSNVCALIDGEKQAGKHICIDAKYLRGKSAGDYVSEGRFVHKDEQIILVDGENSGEVFTVPCDGYMGSTFKQLWVSEKMSLQYVLHFISFYKDLLRNSKKGAAIPHLNKEIFYTLVIGIPPKQEQERIVRRIEQLMQLLK